MTLDLLKIDSDVENTNADVRPGGFTLPTGLYPMVVEVAYMSKANSGAIALRVHFKAADDSGATLRQAFWVVSGNAKGNKNYYVTKQGKKRLLPGMEQANQLAMITTGNPLGNLSSEKKSVKLWNRDAGEEVPTEVDCITKMHGQKVLVGIHKIRDNRVTPDSSGVELMISVVRGSQLT